jgi:hypothetical protein
VFSLAKVEFRLWCCSHHQTFGMRLAGKNTSKGVSKETAQMKITQHKVALAKAAFM